MGVIKDNYYSPEEIHLAKIGKAIGHPARKKILDRLMNGNLCRNIDLSKELNLSVPCIASHLQKLREAGLIKEVYHIHYHEIHLNVRGFELLKLYLSELLDWQEG